MSLATLAELYDRVDGQLLLDLTIDRKVDADNPATDQELAQRDTKCQAALDSSSSVILGFRPLIASSLWPASDLQSEHCQHLALRALSRRRIGNDYKSITDAAQEVIDFYKSLITRTETLGDAGVSHDAPPFAFNDSSLKGFTE